MKILIVSPFFPYPSDNGGVIRIYNLIRHLSGLHEITLLSYINPDQLPLQDNLGPFCRMVTLLFPYKSRSWMFHALHLLSLMPYFLVAIDRRFEERWQALRDEQGWGAKRCEIFPE